MTNPYEIQSPDCPQCGMPPGLRFDDQFWCLNVHCSTLTWTPSKTIAENMSDVHYMNLEGEKNEE